MLTIKHLLDGWETWTFQNDKKMTIIIIIIIIIIITIIITITITTMITVIMINK